MATYWNSNPSWTNFESINGGFMFESMDQITPDVFNKLVQNMQYLYNHSSKEAMDLSATYPVGTIYMTLDADFRPAAQFGGTWEQLKDRFLIGASDENYPANSTGGKSSVALKYSNLPENTLRAIKNNLTTSKSISGSAWGTQSVAANSYVATGVTYANDLGDSYAKENVNTMPPYRAVYMWKRTA